MSDRGICDRCRKPAVKHNGGWLCPTCGAERPYDGDRDQKKTFPTGYWQSGGSRGPDRSR